MKKIIAYILIAAMMLSVIGCSGKKPTKTDAAADTANKEKIENTAESGSETDKNKSESDESVNNADNKDGEEVSHDENATAIEGETGGEDTAGSNDTTGDKEAAGDNTTTNNDTGSDIEIITPMVISYSKTLSRPYSGLETVTIKDMSFRLSEEDAKKWPRLNKALIKYDMDTKSAVEKEFKSAKETIQEELDYQINEKLKELSDVGDNSQSYQSILENIAEDDNWPFYIRNDIETDKCLHRADAVAFSIYEDYFGDYGGAHPIYGSTGHSFDTETGHELMVEDVITDMEALRKILKERLLKEYAELNLNEETIDTVLDNSITGNSGDQFNWILDRDAVVFYFNPYCLTSFAGGMQVIRLGFDEYPELMNEKYTVAPEVYIKHLTTSDDGGACEDINGDGKKETIRAYSTHTNPEIGFGTFYQTISIDDKEETFFETDEYANDFYFLHTGNGNYIYNFVETPGIGNSVHVYDLKDGNVKRVHRYIGGSMPIVSYEYDGDEPDDRHMSSSSYTETKISLVNPDNFVLESFTQAVGSAYGIADYKVGEDGLPYRLSETFDVTGYYKEDNNSGQPFVFKTKVPLTMDLLKEDGTVFRKKATINTGTELTYIRTDDRTFADFRMSDGIVARAEIHEDDWTQYVAGVEVERALQGIMYYD